VDLAQIDLARKDHQAAFPRLVEAYQTFTRLQRPDAIAVVGSTLGQLLIAADQPGWARQVLTASRDGRQQNRHGRPGPADQRPAGPATAGIGENT